MVSELASADLLLHEGLIPVSRPLVPSWDLAVVLEGLKGPPFEPLQGTNLKFLSLKAVLLLALASAKLVSDIHGAPVMHTIFPQGICFPQGMILKPNLAFVPKVVGSCSPIVVPVRAVHNYVEA